MRARGERCCDSTTMTTILKTQGAPRMILRCNKLHRHHRRQRQALKRSHQWSPQNLTHRKMWQQCQILRLSRASPPPRPHTRTTRIYTSLRRTFRTMSTVACYSCRNRQDSPRKLTTPSRWLLTLKQVTWFTMYPYD